MFGRMKITFEGGKGNNHLVSVMFPDDCCDALRKLADPEIRQSVEISDKNIYLFPASHMSDSHVSGWYSVNRVCRDARLVEPDKITATNMRHRASTVYAALDIPEKDRRLFYKHMGHGSLINEHIYQAPLAEATISHVGKHLVAIDGTVPATTDDIEPSVAEQEHRRASTQVPTSINADYTDPASDRQETPGASFEPVSSHRMEDSLVATYSQQMMTAVTTMVM